jgi:hypothetical protein
MQFSVPAFLQVERGQYKSLLECNCHEFVSALMRENEPIRDAQLSRLLRAKRDEWLAAPHIILADILLQHPGAQIRIPGLDDHFFGINRRRAGKGYRSDSAPPE